MSQPPMISVCIVTGRRPRLLDRCLASLQAQIGAPAWELLVCSDRDRRLAELVHARFPEATVGLVDGSLPGAARNFLVERAHGQLLLFLDDDVTVGKSLLRRVAAVASSHPEASLFGGPNETPEGSAAFQVVQGAVLASMVGSGPVRRRYGPHPPGCADERSFTLCNLAIRREAMLPFAHDLVCAEENALMAAMSRRGDLLYYDPKLLAYHERRPTARAFAAQMIKYGKGRGQLLRRQPSTFRPVYLLPVALVVGGFATALAVFWTPWALVALAVYGAMVVAGSLRVALSLRRIKAAPTAVVLFLILHWCYGFGLLTGLRRPKRPPSPTWLSLPADRSRSHTSS